MHWLPSTVIFPKTSWKCLFENLAEIYLILLFTHFIVTLNIKSMLIPNLRTGICLHINFISITRNVNLAVILHLEEGVTQIYHFTLQTSKICLSWHQCLHGEMYLDLSHPFKCEDAGSRPFFFTHEQG